MASNKITLFTPPLQLYFLWNWRKDLRRPFSLYTVFPLIPFLSWRSAPGSATGHPGKDSQLPPKQIPGSVGSPAAESQSWRCRAVGADSAGGARLQLLRFRINKLACGVSTVERWGFSSAFPAKTSFAFLLPFWKSSSPFITAAE